MQGGELWEEGEDFPEAGVQAGKSKNQDLTSLQNLRRREPSSVTVRSMRVNPDPPRWGWQWMGRVKQVAKSPDFSLRGEKVCVSAERFLEFESGEERDNLSSKPYPEFLQEDICLNVVAMWSVET